MRAAYGGPVLVRDAHSGQRSVVGSVALVLIDGYIHKIHIVVFPWGAAGISATVVPVWP